jgi:hypothetical protein
MNLLIPFLAAIAVMLGLAWAFSRMKTQNAALLLRVGLGVAGVVGGILLTVRGLAVAGIPVLAAGLGLLGVAARGGQSGKGQGGRRDRAQMPVPAPVQASASRRRAAPGPVRNDPARSRANPRRRRNRHRRRNPPRPPRAHEKTPPRHRRLRPAGGAGAGSAGCVVGVRGGREAT